MSKYYSHLLSPLKVRGLVLPNRMTSSTSVPHFLMGPEPYLPQHMIELFANRAKSGAGVVTLSHTYAPMGLKGMKMAGDTEHFPILDMYEPQCQNYLIQFCDAVHYYGSKACMNLTRPVMPEWNVVDDPKRGAKAYTPEIIDKMIDAYVEQAVVAKKLGFDMGSVHFAYRSSFAGAFFSPLTNTRTDEYGGSLENRSKVVLEIFRRIKAACGEDFVLEGLISATDLPGGYTFEDTKRFAKMSEGLIDILQIRMGDPDESHPMGFHVPNPTLPYAEELKAMNLDTVIEPIGGYLDPDVCDAIIRDGKADLIGMARTWVCNDNYVELLKQGRGDDVTPCVRCNKCHVISHNAPYRSACTVNPAFGVQTYLKERIAPITPPSRIAVVGGGPAGMETAIIAAKRGNHVTLFEKADHLGGQLIPAGVPDFKWPLKNFSDWLIRQTAKNGVEVRLNTEATRETLEAEGFDVVVAALGAVPAVPPIPGLKETAGVITAVDALVAPEKVRGEVVIIGAGEIGVETGVFFGRKGLKVTILEMGDKVAPEATPIHYRETFDHTWQSVENLRIQTGAKVKAVTSDGVLYDTAAGEQTVHADTVIVAAGSRALNDAALGFYSDKYDFHMVGDCTGVGTVMTAMRTGYAVANQL